MGPLDLSRSTGRNRASDCNGHSEDPAATAGAPVSARDPGDRRAPQRLPAVEAQYSVPCGDLPRAAPAHRGHLVSGASANSCERDTSHFEKLHWTTVSQNGEGRGKGAVSPESLSFPAAKVERIPKTPSPASTSPKCEVDTPPNSRTPTPDSKATGKNASRLPFRKRPFPNEEAPPSREKPRSLLQFSPAEGATEAARRESQPTAKVRRREDGERSSYPPEGANHEHLTTAIALSDRYHFYPIPPQYMAPQYHYPIYIPNLILHAPPMSPVYPMEEDKLVADITIATQQDDDGDTALHIAVVQGKMDLVQRLIYILQKSNRDLDTYNNLRQTPLHLAVITHNAPLVGALLSGGADVGALDRNGQTAAHLCCEHADTACLRTLLMHTPRTLDLETRNYEGLTPLHVAVQSGSCELVKLLLDSGADIDAVDIKSGRSPLIHAVDINNVEMVSFLIEGGASVNAQSYSGNSALHSACGRGQLDTVRLLLKNGADSGLKNYHNDTALSIAKDRRVTDVLRGKGTRSLNSKPIEPHPGTPSPHSHSPSSHQHNANGTPAHSPGLAPRQSPLAPSPAPSSPAPAQPQKQASLAPPQEPSSDQTPEEAGLPRATQDRNQPGEGMARRVPPIEVIGCLPPEHRLQFQLIPVGVRALPHQLPSLVPFPVDMQNGYYLEQLYPPPFHSLHPLPHPALPFHPSSCSSSLSVSSSPPSSSSCSPANHSLPPHVPQSRPSSRGSNHQWDGSPEVRGES